MVLEYYVRTHMYQKKGTYVHVYVPMVHNIISTYTCTETVLREAMKALVRVQAHMLARSVVEIRAADIAVELEP